MLVRVLPQAEAALFWLVGEIVLASASPVEESVVPMMVGILLPLVPEILFALVEERPDPVVLGMLLPLLTLMGETLVPAVVDALLPVVPPVAIPVL